MEEGIGDTFPALTILWEPGFTRATRAHQHHISMPYRKVKLDEREIKNARCLIVPLVKFTVSLRSWPITIFLTVS